MTSTRHPHMGRFAMFPEWVFTHPAVQGNMQAMKLFLWVGLHATPDGRAWARQERLADELGISIDTLHRATAALRQAGALRTAIRRGPMGGVSHLEYRLVYDRPTTTAGALIRTDADQDATQGVLIRVHADQATLIRTHADQDPLLIRKSQSTQSAPMRIRYKEDPDHEDPDRILRERAGTSQDHGTIAAPGPPSLPTQDWDAPATQPNLPMLASRAPPLTKSALWPPPYLDREFRQRCGDRRIDLPGWYVATLDALGDQPMVPPPREFWKQAFEAEIAPRLGGTRAPRERRAEDVRDGERARIQHQAQAFYDANGCMHSTCCESERACVWRYMETLRAGGTLCVDVADQVMAGGDRR